MTRGSKITLGIGAVVVVAAVSAVPMLDRIATRRYERKIVSGIKARYGGDLTMESFRVSVISSRASVSGFRYEDPKDATYRLVMTGGPTVVDIEALSLRPKSVRFREVTLDRPELTLSRTPRGDWDRGMPGVARDLLDIGIRKAKKALGLKDVEVKKKPSGEIEVTDRARVVELGKLSIKGAKVTYEDNRFTQAPIRLTLRDFNFEGKEISSADIWGTLLTSDANGVLEIGPARIDIQGRTRSVGGENKKVWTLEARGIPLRAIAGPVLHPLLLDVKEGTADVRLSHLFDLSMAQRSAFVIDYDIKASGVKLDVLEGKGAAALLQGPAQRAKAYVDMREGKLELAFAVETAPDLALLGKDAGNILDTIGKLTYEALQQKLLESMGLEGS